MPVYRTQATIRTADNVSANYATNTWHVLAPDLVELALWEAALTAFYQAVDVRISTLAGSTNALQYKHYDLADPEPRAPVLTGQASLSPSGSPLPPEVALVMSFQAEQSSGVPQARRRNRIYLPFLNTGSGHTDGRPASAAVTDVTNAGAALLAASGPTSSDWQWIVYSPTDSTFDLVDNGWVDNEWDTQRRRGRVRTSRTTF
jgi:hypothetical protein